MWRSGASYGEIPLHTVTLRGLWEPHSVNGKSIILDQSLYTSGSFYELVKIGRGTRLQKSSSYVYYVRNFVSKIS